MSGQIRDFRCSACDRLVLDYLSAYGDWPYCGLGHDLIQMQVTWERGQAPKTDVYGSPVYSDASGQWHRSTREKEKHLADWGFTPAGDPVGGARKELRIKNTGFSYPGQERRTSTGEKRPT